ncbi:hypothetical protein H0H92_000388 [Tricholoma furcatifolium]|nr:hypothetical protein H0H92_000388 [Tricholoma furcatifolium]
MSNTPGALPPAYGPLGSSPPYSSEPNRGEQTLQRTLRHETVLPTGTVTRSSGNTTVKLVGQQEGAKIPCYGRRGTVKGTLYVKDCQKVVRISMKIEGKLVTVVSGRGSQTIELLNQNLTLWRKGSAIQLSNGMPISYKLPSLMLRRLKISFLYCPRTRANRPILRNSAFYSSPKTDPNEWYQTVAGIRTRQMTDSSQCLVHVHLFVPAARVYSLVDTIPLHIQIIGSLEFLKELLAAHKDVPQACRIHTSVKIKASLRRQIGIDMQGQILIQDHTIGEGDIWEVPPSLCEIGGGAHLEWKGKLRFRKDVTIGSFRSGNIILKDFIDVLVDPRGRTDNRQSFLALKISVPVRIVEDSYSGPFEWNPGV